MWKWIKGSLQRKLSFIMLVLVTIPILFFGIFSYWIASNIAEEKAKQSGLDTLKIIETSLDFIINDVENLSLYIIGEKNVQQYLKSGQNQTSREEVVGPLMNLVNSKDYISSITIYPSDQSEPLSTLSIYETGLPEIEEINQTHLTNQSKWWSPLYINHTSAGLERVISLVRPIRDINSFQTIGTLVISLNHEEFTKYITSSTLGYDEGFLLVLDQEGRVLVSKEESWLLSPINQIIPGIDSSSLTKGTANFGIGENKKTVLHSSLTYPEWEILGVIPYDEFTSQNQYILTLTMISVAIASVLIFVIILSAIKRVFSPIRRLAKLLTNINVDQPLPHYAVGSTDEIGQLIKSYNFLGKRIELLKQQVMKNEARKKEADLRALQAQINPHFLYNTLGSIHWIALMNGDKKTSGMVESLGQFLRFSLNKGKEYCTVNQELSHIQNYLTIQEIRFPDLFTFECLVDDEVKDYEMIKLLLQPLVENALIHGIQKKQGKGIITVNIELDAQKRLLFTIEDNGMGIEPEKLQQLLQQLDLTLDESIEAGGSYGLRNVKERLWLHYGDESSFKIDSEYGKGTSISFVIPRKVGRV